jgi:pimeloyl-ACP methyl ester carboxylesterase
MQGVLDPLNDAQQRAKDLAKTCPDYVRMVLVEAGHCPHDEQPEKARFFTL